MTDILPTKTNVVRRQSAASWMLKQNKSYQKINREWSVHHSELNFNRELRRGHQYSIHEGQWHGDVFIYKLNLAQAQAQHAARVGPTSGAQSRPSSSSTASPIPITSSTANSLSSSITSSITSPITSPNSITSSMGSSSCRGSNSTGSACNCANCSPAASPDSKPGEVFSFRMQQQDGDYDDDVFVASAGPASPSGHLDSDSDRAVPAPAPHAMTASGDKSPATKLHNRTSQLDSAYSSLSSLDQCPSPICCRQQQQRQQQHQQRQRQQLLCDTTATVATTGVPLLSRAGSHLQSVVGFEGAFNVVTGQRRKQETSAQQVEETVKFYEHLVKLCSVAHENFVLFMGASLDLRNLDCSIIMGKCNGPTLYQCLHQPEADGQPQDRPFRSRYHSMDANNKRNIAHQIALGMAYLHGKQMVHGKLSSVNIILDYRVKICLMDHGVAQTSDQRPGYATLNRGQLTYLSPELIRSLYVEPLCVGPPSLAAPTKQADVYAFGTLLYELFSEQFPYRGATCDEIIWRSGSGIQDQMSDCPELARDQRMRQVILDCWCFDAHQRATFSEIALDILNVNTSPSDNCDSYAMDYVSPRVSSSSSPASPSALWGEIGSWTPVSHKQQSMTAQLQHFNNIRIMKKQKNHLSTRLFSSKESMF